MDTQPTPAILVATMESGETWEDPSEDGLFMLFEDVENGESSWLIIDRLTDPSGQTYFQSAKEPDGYLVEHRDGGPDRHFGARVPDFRAAHALASAWAHERPGWRDAVPWEPVDLS